VSIKKASGGKGFREVVDINNALIYRERALRGL
jgi:hypothetical protein